MYRIEVAPGEETVFRTIEELAVGIRNGVITPRSRIYHNASQKWLPIGLHPHYKKALELPAAKAPQAATPTPVPAAPRIKSLRDTGEHRVAVEEAAPKVPPPVTSPIVAMQQEVLRDLPVVAIPEPLPWAAPAPSAPSAITRIAQAVQAEPARITVPPAAVQSQPTAIVTYAPVAPPEPAPAPADLVHGDHEEHSHARPTARRSNRGGGRPLVMVGVAAALVVAGHFGLTAMRSGPAERAESIPPDTAAEPASVEPAADGPRPSATPASVPPAARTSERVTSAPARVPMTPGPAFAGSAPVSAYGSPATPTVAAPAPTPDSAPASSAPAITPAPVELDLALPDLASDPLVPAARTGDTTAMKKILRALNGAKPSESPAAP